MTSSWEKWKGIDIEPAEEVEDSTEISVAGVVKVVNEIPYGGTEAPTEVIIPSTRDIISEGI